jgi:PAS domain S-box-containing protein
MDFVGPPQPLKDARSRSEGIANTWYAALARTSFASYPAAHVRRQLVELAEQALSLLFSEPFDRVRAEAIGIELVALHYVQPEALGQTQEVLARQMTQDIPADQIAQLQPRLAALLGAVADGFFRAARDMILMEQEQIRNALVMERQQMESALLESEARYRSLVETSPDAISLTTLEGDFIFCNQQKAALHGFEKAQDMEEMNALDWVAPQDRQRALDYDTQTLEQGTVRNIEYSLRRQDGSVFPAEFSASVVADANGEPEAFIRVTRDITERKRAESAERELRALAEALRDTAAALNSTLDSDQVFDRILENVGRVLPHDAANIMLVDEEGNTRVARHRGYVERGLDEWLLNLRLPVAGTSGLRQMADTCQPLIISNTQDYAGWVDLPETRWLQSFASAPICVNGKVVGFLNLDSAEAGFFSAAHAERLQAFADQAALALENAQLFEATRRSVERLTLLHEAGQALTQADSIEVLYREITRRAVQLVDAHASLLMLYDGDDHLAIVAAENFSEHTVGSRVMLGEGVSGRAARHREPRQVRNYAVLDLRERTEQPVNPNVVSIVALPLIWQDQLVGVLAITDDREREFDADELHMLTLFSALTAAALEQRRAVAQIQAREAEARALTAQLARAQEEERARIAAQLQDLIGHRIVALQENARNVSASLPPDGPLAEIAAESATLLNETRQLISSLAMDLDLKVLDTLGLGQAMRQYIERVSASFACAVSLRISGREHRLPAEIERVVFRGLQEILSNVLRYAQPTKVSVSLHVGAKSLRLSMQNDGRELDLDALPAGMEENLANLRRQIEGIDGAFSLSSAPGRGAMVALHLRFRMPKPPQLQLPVMLIHSHEVIRHGLRLALTESGEFTCVGEADDGLSALHQIELSQPELVLMEVQLPGISGIEVTRQMASRFPHMRVIVLSYTADETYLEQALQAGAKGFALVSDGDQQIIAALRNVSRGEMFVSPDMADAWDRWKARAASSTPFDLLTAREREVLQLIAAGYPNRLIAEELGISSRTVEVHRRNLKAKLKYKSSAQLVQFAIRHGLVSLKV